MDEATKAALWKRRVEKEDAYYAAALAYNGPLFPRGRRPPGQYTSSAVNVFGLPSVPSSVGSRVRSMPI